ncbi:hypothetical protein BgiMline_025458, partial [Biomphalaria glabrata]
FLFYHRLLRTTGHVTKRLSPRPAPCLPPKRGRSRHVLRGCLRIARAAKTARVKVVCSCRLRLRQLAVQKQES